MFGIIIINKIINIAIDQSIFLIVMTLDLPDMQLGNNCDRLLIVHIFL